MFVYFHQISFTMKDNKINGYNKDKTMTKLERKMSPIDDDGAKMHCSLAKSVLAP